MHCSQQSFVKLEINEIIPILVSITNDVFKFPHSTPDRKGALDSYNMDFDEEEEDDENETDNVLIDMNMFMNSAQDQD